MRSLLFACSLILVLASVAYPGFDYEISTGYHGAFTLNSSESILVEGGGAVAIMAYDSSYIEVQGTAPLQELTGGIYEIGMFHHSTMRYYGGETGGISMYGNARSVFEGGRIEYLSSFQNVFDVIVDWDDDGNPIYNTHIELISKDYAFNPTTAKLTGTWVDDSTFNIQLLNQTGWEPVIDNIKFTIIPEPATLLLIAIGGLLLRRTRGGY